MRIIGIAGGSGSGKSTLAVSVCRKYPDLCALLHIDDYFKAKAEVPLLNGFTNWDHPEALRFDDLLSDINLLAEGRSATVMTKSELYHPTYDYTLKNRKEHVIEPKPILIIEGYLALHDPRIREKMDLKIYLDIPLEESTKRRSANKFALDQEYFEKVLIPMHHEFVESTKKYADIVLDVSGMTADQVLDVIEVEIVNNSQK